MKRVFVPLMFVLLVAAFNTAPAQVLMRGDVDVWSSGSRLWVYVEKLENMGDAQTELLRFRVWATEHHWGAPGRKKIIGANLFGRLNPGQDRWDVRRAMHIHRPDRGWWYITVTLEERSYDENGRRIWLIRDVAEFDEVYFGGWWNPFWPWD